MFETFTGNFLGGLSSVASYELGARAISVALDACSVRPQEVSEVILGQVRSGEVEAFRILIDVCALQRFCLLKIRTLRFDLSVSAKAQKAFKV